MNEQHQVRQEIYGLLAHLFRTAPTKDTIDWLSALELENNPDHAMTNAWLELSNAAQHSELNSLKEEYQDLFIGIGRGEVMQFASWHIAGALMEKPLVALRQDLMQLGFERIDDVKEPEDHISALCEVMAMLIDAGDDEILQQRFFNRHIQPWYLGLCKQINNAEHASFYQSVSLFVAAFFTVEQTRFALNRSKIEFATV